MALVLVLAVLGMAILLTVCFLVRSGTERAAGAAYHATVTTGLLTASAVNLVEAQINEAVSQTGGHTGRVWCSQPGAVRVYEKNGADQTIYRLYSAGSLTADMASDLARNDLPEAALWRNAPALWTDLNEPAPVPNARDAEGHFLDPATPGSLAYPILDARDPTPDPHDPQAVRYLDSRTDEWGDNWGFSINGDHTINPVGATVAAPCMPVRWIYVLADGKLAAPDAAGTDPNVIKIAGASAQNPVVGRIAFWTDDETCKVNVNTAAGSRSLRPYTGDGSRRILPLPAPWDVPRFKNAEEKMLFADNQPVHGEYQRYPGHPATTDLFNICNVLGMLGTDYPVALGAASPQPTPGSTPSPFFQNLPRYSDDNASQGGARNTTLAAAPAPVHGGLPKPDRLYGSLGEMLYSYDPIRNNSGVTRAQAEAGKFFLTAHSRAPEETLFGTPRVSMWPVDSDPAKRTDYDNRMALCARTGSGANSLPYLFQRADACDPSSDWTLPRNQQLYQYLQSLTAAEVPGTGGTLLGKYGPERDQILTEMCDYIRATNLTDHSDGDTTEAHAAHTFTSLTPGQVVPLKVGSTRGLGRVPTLSEIGLLIICTADGNSPLAYKTPVNDPKYPNPVSPVNGSANDPRYVSNLPVAQFLRDASGGVVGIDNANPSTHPFPANHTLTDDYTSADPGAGKQLAPGQRRLQAMLLLETACPALGNGPMTGTNNFQVDASGLNGLSIAGQHPFPDRTTTATTPAGPKLNGDGVVHGSNVPAGSLQNWGGIAGFRALLTAKATDPANTPYNEVYNAWSGFNPTAKARYPYRFISNPFTVDATGGKISLGGGCTLRMQVPPLGAKAAVTYQTFSVDFPALSALPVPDLPQNGVGYARTVNGQTTAVPTNAADWWNFDRRIAWTVHPDVSYQPYLDGQTSSPSLGPGCVVRVDNAPTGTWQYKSSYTTPIFIPGPTYTGSGDVLRTLVVRDGDYRLTAALENVDATGTNASSFVKGPGYDSAAKVGCLFMDQGSSSGTAGVELGGKLAAGAPYAPWLTPKVPAALAGDKQASRDWDSGLPGVADGAYANKPDEGAPFVAGASPYYSPPAVTGSDLQPYFAANRIVPSPVMFGSLPTGVLTGNTWRTLLFRPQANRPSYANLSGPPDHYWLDLFTMPTVEPYAISEPYSTAGKINMNYQIAPFGYLRRDTGVRAVLASELIAQAPLASAGMGSDGTCAYKGTPDISAAATGPRPLRLPLSLDETHGTLQQFEDRFAKGDLFRSATEICDLYLVPRGYALPAFRDDWYGSDFALAGDNVRERPYADIYPRLTTRSNTFTVHYRVQVLRAPDATAKSGLWDERRGSVVGEARGSTTIERYLDPERTNLPDYASTPFDQPLARFHEWRVVATSRFPP